MPLGALPNHAGTNVLLASWDLPGGPPSSVLTCRVPACRPHGEPAANRAAKCYPPEVRLHFDTGHSRIALPLFG